MLKNIYKLGELTLMKNYKEQSKRKFMTQSHRSKSTYAYDS